MPDPQSIFANAALTPQGWARNVRVEIAGDGTLGVIAPEAAARKGDQCVDVLLPALSNLHSHSFQRVLAGMIEKASLEAGDDDFWSWRRAMYRSLSQLTPDHMQAIAALVQIEMLEAGYAAVGEFHYVHHDQGGASYTDPAETSLRLMQAAQETGIGLTHLPVLYMRGGMDDAPLEEAQKRFGCDLDRFEVLHAVAKKALKDCPSDFRIGVAPHSLRAVSKAGLDAAVKLAGDDPLHIHIAEQTAEVEAVQAAYGTRPVRWLLDNYKVGPQWCAVHATHMDASEVKDLAKSGAVAGLCPLTEANLGDGAFDGKAYMRAGGAFGVGSDSNFRISLSEELRQLEYSQRLRDQRRIVLAEKGDSVGRALYEGAAVGGGQALGRKSGRIETGALADLVALDADNALLHGLYDNAILDSWIFAGDDRLVAHVWSAGRHVVNNGRHEKRDSVIKNYQKVARELRSVM